MIVTDTKYYSTLTQKQYDTAKEGNAAEAEYTTMALREFNTTHSIKWYRPTTEDIACHMSQNTLYEAVLMLSNHIKILEMIGVVNYWEDMFMSETLWERFTKAIAANSSISIMNAWSVPADASVEEIAELWSLLKAIDPSVYALFPGDYFATNCGLTIHIMENRRGTSDVIAGTNIVITHMDKTLRRISETAEALANLGRG